MLVRALGRPRAAPFFHQRVSRRPRGSGGRRVAQLAIPRFGEIAVNTRPVFRRQGWGRSVVAVLSGHLIDSFSQALYVVPVENDASAGRAESVGFTDTGAQEFFRPS